MNLRPGKIFAGGSDTQGVGTMTKTWGLFALLFIISMFFAAIVVNFGTLSFLAIVVTLVAIPLVYLTIAYPDKGVYVYLICAYSVMFFSPRMIGKEVPVGTTLDAMLALLLFGFFLKQKYRKHWDVLKGGISLMIFIWLGYNLVQVINPNASSRLAWVYTVRSVALVTLAYFVFLFHIKNRNFIRTIIKLWLAFSIIGAIYAFKQEHFGFANFEQIWLASDPKYKSLYYIGNHWRVFSIYADPATFAYNMVVSIILCLCLMTGPLATWKKVALAVLSGFFFLCMLYSGTRSAYVLIPVGFVFYSILNFRKQIIWFWIIAAPLLLVLRFMPPYTYTIYRFQTAFKPSEDASYNVRAANQKRIQPYIQSHPLGGGLGSTGTWGQRFSPNSYLANFPPDSGYVRVAVELGWVGLLVFCTFLFVILRRGIKNYFRIRDPELKSYCMAMVIIVFVLGVGNFPQEALVQYPLSVYFYLAVALIVVTYKLDKEAREQLISPETQTKPEDVRA